MAHPGGFCPECGRWRDSLQRDHILPRFKGGTDAPENIQFLCANCHEDKTREDLAGRTMSPEARAKIGAAQKGRTMSPETRAKMSVARKGTVNSPETRARISAGRAGKGLGRICSAETRAKIAASKIGVPRSPETIAKMTGRFVSVETRAKQSAARKGKTPWNKGVSNGTRS